MDENKSPGDAVHEQWRSQVDAHDAQSHPGDFLLSELYEEWIKEDLEYIKFIHSEDKVFQQIREKHSDQWEIVELCREALFDNAKLIKFLKERIEDGREKIEELGRV